MADSYLWNRVQSFFRKELLHLTTIHASDRRWQMPLAASLASGLPLLVGAYFGRMDYGLISSLGGLVFLYLSETSLSHRMVSLMTCAFGMITSYFLGVLSHLMPPLMTPMLTFTAILVTMVCRFYNITPPGSFFFIMVAAIGAVAPSNVMDVPLKVGLFAMGCMLSCMIAFLYSLYMLRLKQPRPVSPLPHPTFDFVIFDSIVIGVLVGISLALAQLLNLPQPYWVPVTCAAVIQGVSMRAVWNKQLQRVVGTAMGLLLAWGLLSTPLNNWQISLVIMGLTFLVETFVVRHYALAAVFITPMSILLVEVATLGHASPAILIRARFFDTILGCLIGLVGGVCLHSTRFRNFVGLKIRRFLPWALPD